jgi:hypothetical protein
VSRLCARFEAALSPHAARVLAILVAFSARSLLGWVVAFPLISAVAALGAGSLEGGDRALFEPSGLFLTELVVSGNHALSAAAETSLVLLPIACALLAFPTALLFAAFGHPARGVHRTAARARDRVPHFLAFDAIEAAVWAVLATLGWGAIPVIQGFDTAARHVSFALFAGAALLVLAVSAIGLDVARRRTIASGTGLRSSLEYAIETFRTRGFELAASYVLATGVAALMAVLCARAIEFCAVEREGAWRVALVFLIHQTAILTLVLIRAAWIARVADAQARSPQRTHGQHG